MKLGCHWNLARRTCNQNKTQFFFCLRTITIFFYKSQYGIGTLKALLLLALLLYTAEYDNDILDFLQYDSCVAYICVMLCNKRSEQKNWIVELNWNKNFSFWDIFWNTFDYNDKNKFRTDLMKIMNIELQFTIETSGVWTDEPYMPMKYHHIQQIILTWDWIDSNSLESTWSSMCFQFYQTPRLGIVQFYTTAWAWHLNRMKSSKCWWSWIC